ncbi:Arm DNA-binding domain-containing protein [Avibacterium sp. 20-15]|uniref:Arm DNA-binding domain-containing protein n=1 Tax=unclassified Avibacterium TaxID=2685287 RepID=UPI00202691AD|nr:MULTISPECIES: Arm DNA-binding domain-containing protein [unclassified Avibacterium]MCW9732576.1 Arm DNA-binding domain-containing protein [Avibacterium sp. 20-15]URL02348.1 Arm DNA-binding domain-containing protein [Avibacterium sp. 20-126]URL04728.1 Arm DNA-binding domain-containing protein [Avibacterium sp. 20-132]
MTKINQTFINKLKATGKEERYSLGHKLFLVMTPKGSKSYRYIYRLPDTKAIRKKNLGRADIISLEEALNMTISYLADFIIKNYNALALIENINMLD